MAGVLNFALEENLNDNEIYMLCRASKIQEGLITREALDITTLSELQCLCNFRFKAQDLIELHQPIKLPITFVADNGSRKHSFDGMCVVLRRLTNPSCLYDLDEFFGKELSILSRHRNLVLCHIYSVFEYLLISLDQTWLERCSSRGCPLRYQLRFPRLLIA